jgi:hypothetical protein
MGCNNEHARETAEKAFANARADSERRGRFKADR